MNQRTEEATTLRSWEEGRTKDSILEFVRGVTNKAGPAYVPPDDRVAVFDNDGTLWCEKPMPVQADFLLRRIEEMAVADPSLREKQPFRAASDHDYTWFSRAINNHYRGDDSTLHEMAGGLLQAYAGTSIEEFEIAVEDFMQSAKHPTRGQPYLQCTYAPMIELLNFLTEAGFTSYIASGGGRDFMRGMATEAYGIPPDRVIGSSVTLEYDPNRHTVIHGNDLELFDDGPEKAVRIWSRLGRKPIFACGNSNGDIEMLDFAAAHQPSMAMLIFHDDAANEFSYSAGAEKAVDSATRHGWTVVSMKNDWRLVFPAESPRPIPDADDP